MTRRPGSWVTVYLSRYTVNTLIWITYNHYRTSINLTRLLQRNKDWLPLERGKLFTHTTQIDVVLRVKHSTESAGGRINLYRYKRIIFNCSCTGNRKKKWRKWDIGKEKIYWWSMIIWKNTHTHIHTNQKPRPNNKKTPQTRYDKQK